MPFDVDPAGEAPAERIGRAWRDLRRGPSTAVVAERIFGTPGEPGSVEPGQVDVLDLLTISDGRRMSDLAAALRVDPSTVTRTLQRMEAAGLARRTPAAADGRVVTVELTDEGRRVHDAVAQRRAAIMTAILEPFTDEECDTLVALLERFVASAEAYVTDGLRERTSG